jgi:hypothetical protein
MPVSRMTALLLATVAPRATAVQPPTTLTLQQDQAEPLLLNKRFVQLLAAALPDNAVVGYLRPTIDTMNGSMAAVVGPPVSSSSVAPTNTTALLNSPGAEASEASAAAQGLARRKDVVQRWLELVAFDSLSGLRESPSWSIIANFVVIGILALFLVFDLGSYLFFEKSREPLEAKAADAVKADAVKADMTEDTATKEKDPRRWRILTMCYVATFGSDLYMNSPLSFFPLEIYNRGASQVAVSLMMSIFPAGGMLTSYVIPQILARIAPGRLVRISLLITGLSAAMIGAAVLFRPAAPFVAYSCVVRFIEGFTTMMTDVAAQTIVCRHEPEPPSHRPPPHALSERPL